MRDTKFTIYNNGEKAIRVYKGQEPPEGFVKGHLKKQIAWNKGLTAETDERVRLNTEKCHETRRKNCNYIAWNKGLTKETCPSLHGLSGEANPMYGVHKEAWNKGLTKETNESVAKISSSNKGKEAWNKGFTLENATTEEEIEFFKKSTLKRYDSMKKNGTMGKNKMTKDEVAYYNYLLTKYKEEDIICQYYDDERYPYRCDFYVIPDDIFIEINAHWTHGKKPFDKNDPECLEILNLWEQRAEHSNYYKGAVYVWTILDPEKARTAKEHSLNYITIY